MKTHWKKLNNPNYIGAYTLGEKKEMNVRIKSVQKELVTGTDGKKEECIVAHLHNEKPFILNSTNCKSISHIAASNFIEDWANIEICVYRTEVKAFGEVVEALRVKPPQKKPELTPSNPKWVEAIAFLKGGGKIQSIESSYSISKENKQKLQNESI